MTAPSAMPTLGALSDPSAPKDDVQIGDAPEEYLAAWRTMTLIRTAEEAIGDAVRDGVARCPCHLAVGQEAIAAGVASHLRSTDRVFGTHRSHAHFLAMGGSVRGLFAEVLGRDSGASRGMGGSMHLRSVEAGFLGSVPIVGATIPISVGAALAAKMDGNGDVAVAFFGDGATEEGVFHESLNLASTLVAPVLFVCENNLFSSHLHIDMRQPSDSTRRFAEAHGLPGETVDGNDLSAVRSATDRAVARLRAGGGPAFLECVTYRWRGHVGHREDEDVGVKRSEDLGLWKEVCPIRRVGSALIESGFRSEEELEVVTAGCRDEIREAWDWALGEPFPDETALADRVWARGRP